MIMGKWDKTKSVPSNTFRKPITVFFSKKNVATWIKIYIN